MDSSPTAERSLVRSLTLIPATSLLVTNVIGTGVFLKARTMTCNVGSPTMVLLVYVVAGVFTLAGALTFAELGALMPRSGGQYNFIGAGFGRMWAFLFGWTETLIDGAGSCAAVAIGMAIFLNDFLGGVLSARDTQLVAVGSLIAIPLLTLASVRANGWLASVVTAIKVLLVAGIGIAAFWLGDGSWAHFAGSGAAGACEGVVPSARLGLGGFGAAVVGALWAYNGWFVIAHVAEEIRNPGRTIPRALIWGTTVVVVAYLLINAGYFYVLSPEEVANVPESGSVAGAVMVRLFGAVGAMVLSAGMILSSFGTQHSNFLTVARVPFAMARDGLLPKALATVSPRTRVPTVAVAALSVGSIGFALSGTFDLLTDMIVFVLLFFSGLAVAAVYVLRRALPEVERPYRTWGYPVVPALFLAATVFLMVNTLIATPGRALAGIGIVALGVPVYAFYARKLPQDRREDWIGR